jgi:hypothetical protein
MISPIIITAIELIAVEISTPVPYKFKLSTKIYVTIELNAKLTILFKIKIVFKI